MESTLNFGFGLRGGGITRVESRRLGGEPVFRGGLSGRRMEDGGRGLAQDPGRSPGYPFSDVGGGGWGRLGRTLGRRGVVVVPIFPKRSFGGTGGLPNRAGVGGSFQGGSTGGPSCQCQRAGGRGAGRPTRTRNDRAGKTRRRFSSRCRGDRGEDQRGRIESNRRIGGGGQGGGVGSAGGNPEFVGKGGSQSPEKSQGECLGGGFTSDPGGSGTKSPCPAVHRSFRDAVYASHPRPESDDVFCLVGNRGVATDEHKPGFLPDHDPVGRRLPMCPGSFHPIGSPGGHRGRGTSRHPVPRWKSH